MENSEQFDLELEQLKAMLSETEEADADIQIPVDEEIQLPQDEVLTPQADEQSGTKKKPKESWQKILLMYMHDLLYLLATLVVISMLFLRIVVVSGTSMNNTLLDGDFLLVLSNVLYREPEAGDIVVISKESFDNGKPIVKRIIATEGQTVDIDFNLGIVSVDGVELSEPYTTSPTTEKEGIDFPVTVPEGCVFVLGDNRCVSKDSRHPDIGLIDEREILGKVFLLFFPGTNGEDAHGNPNQPRDFSRIGGVDGWNASK